MDRLEGVRKFIVCMTSLVLTTGLCAWKMDGDQLVDFLPWSIGLHLGLYGGANVFEWVAKRGKPA